MKSFFLMIVVSFISVSGFAFHPGVVSKVNYLPSNQINCALLFQNRGVNARLFLADGGVIFGTHFLRGTLVLSKNGQVQGRFENIEVIVSQNLERITAGNLYLNGEEGIPRVVMSLQKNDLLSRPDLIGYTAAIVSGQQGSISTGIPASNAACTFLKK